MCLLEEYILMRFCDNKMEPTNIFVRYIDGCWNAACSSGFSSSEDDRATDDEADLPDFRTMISSESGDSCSTHTVCLKVVCVLSKFQILTKIRK